MEKHAEDQQLREARQCLHRIILEQRAATEELRSSNRELEALLNELLSAKPELRESYQAAALEEPGLLPPLKRTRTTPANVDMARLEREAERVLERAREAVRESTLLRLRAKRLRSALRSQPGRSKTHPPGHLLSKREHQVLELIVEGKSSKEIAAELGISFKTAVTHRASIMGKLDVHEIASVVREAIRRGLV